MPFSNHQHICEKLSVKSSRKRPLSNALSLGRLPESILVSEVDAYESFHCMKIQLTSARTEWPKGVEEIG